MSAKMYRMSQADVTGQLQVSSLPWCEKGSVGNTPPPRAKMMFLPMNVFSGGKIIRKKVLTEELLFLTERS